MDQSSVASSFYEAPVEYDESKTRVLYEHMKMNFREIQKLLKIMQKDLISVQKETSITVKLIEKIQSVEKLERESKKSAPKNTENTENSESN